MAKGKRGNGGDFVEEDNQLKSSVLMCNLYWAIGLILDCALQLFILVIKP